MYHPTFLKDGICVLGIYYEMCDGSASLKVHLHAMLAADVLQLSLSPLMYGTTMWGLLLLL